MACICILCESDSWSYLTSLSKGRNALESDLDDTLYGTRDKRGHWTPHDRPKRAPVFIWPARPKAFLIWLFGYPGYLWPWNMLYFAVSFAVWICLTPPLSAMRDFGVGWVSLILLRNVVLTLLVFGGFHLVLYIRRRQQTAFKYNAKWPGAGDSSFIFGSQTAENVFLTMCSGVPIWTAYEVLTLWLFANDYIPYVEFSQHPVYFVALLLLMPLWASFHFYLIHRLIHVGPLYHLIHKVHHKNVNPGPWSGMSMHPLEHLLYFSAVLIYLVVPSHPLHALYLLLYQGLAPARGHLGFDRIVIDDDKSIDTEGYFHYLHHKYFEVNYGGGLIPLDEWFGTAHNGSPASDEAMYKRMKARKKSSQAVSQ